MTLRLLFLAARSPSRPPDHAVPAMALLPCRPSFLVSSVFFTDSLPSLPLSKAHEARFESDAAAAEEVEFVAADAEQELISMMATLGLPTTFGTSSEVKSIKKGRKVDAVASRVVGTQVVDVEHDVSERGTNATSQTLSVEFPAHDCDILHASGIQDSSIVDEVHHGSANHLTWEPVWDADYQRYYYCNIHTWETTWDVPEGVEDYNAYSHIESGENFVDEIAVSADPFQAEGPIEEAHAYESSFLIPNSFVKHTGSGEVGSLVNGTNDSGVSVAPLGGKLDLEAEETSNMMKRKSRAVLRIPSSYPELESVGDLGGKVAEVEQSTVLRTIVLQEKVVDQQVEETCNVMSMKTTQAGLNVHVKTRTKIRQRR